jgi:hypothetical protein
VRFIIRRSCVLEDVSEVVPAKVLSLHVLLFFLGGIAGPWLASPECEVDAAAFRTGSLAGPLGRFQKRIPVDLNPYCITGDRGQCRLAVSRYPEQLSII